MNELQSGCLTPANTCISRLSVLSFLIALCGAFPAHAAIIPSGDVTPVYDNTDPWNVPDQIFGIGITADGQVLIDGSSGVVAPVLTILGNTTGVTGTLGVDGAGSTFSSQGTFIGSPGIGILNVSNGATATPGSTSVGSGVTGSGQLAISGTDTTVDTNILVVAGSFPILGPGVPTPSGIGTVTIDDLSMLTVGNAPTPVRESLIVSSTFDRAFADLTIFGGGSLTNNAGGETLIGNGASEFGTVDVVGVGATLEVRRISVGFGGTGTLNIEDGGFVGSSVSIIGDLAGSVGTVNVSGPDSLWQPSILAIGGEGSGTLMISAGGEVDASNTRIGDRLGGAGGNVTVTGANSKLSVNFGLDVGDGSTGTLTLEDNATAEVGIDAVIGDDSQGTVNVRSGSLFDVGGVLTVGENSGTLSIESGGGVKTGGNVVMSRFGRDAFVTVNGTGSLLDSEFQIEVGDGGNGTGFLGL